VNKPIVDGVEKEFGNAITVIHVNVLEPAGKILGQKFDFRYTPTFIFFNADGEEQWRVVGMLNPNDVRTSLAHP
jgi:thioredoxin-related protein